MEAIGNQLLSEQLLQNFNNIEKMCIQMKFSKIDSNNIEPRNIVGDVLRNKLQLLFSGQVAQTNDNPTAKGPMSTSALPKT